MTIPFPPPKKYPIYNPLRVESKQRKRREKAMAKEKIISYAKFQEQYGSENACREYLFKSRWKDGYACPKCGCMKFSFHTKRNLYQCCDCRHQQSLTAGSVMHHTICRSRLGFGQFF
jgi:hypothetical protein